MPPGDEPNTFEEADAAGPVALPQTAWLLPGGDGDLFLLDIQGTATISLLPDLVDIQSPDGTIHRAEETTIASAFLAEKVYIDGVPTLVSLNLENFELVRKLDDLASTDENPVYFWSITTDFVHFMDDFTGEDENGNPVTYEFTDDYYLWVFGNGASPSPDAGRYLVTIGNATGQRAATWGDDWIDLFVAPPVQPETPFVPSEQPDFGDERDIVKNIGTVETDITTDGAAMSVSSITYDEIGGLVAWEDDQGSHPIPELEQDQPSFSGQIGSLVGDIAIQAGLLGLQATAESELVVQTASAASSVYGSYGTYTTLRDGFSDMIGILEDAMSEVSGDNDAPSGRDYSQEAIDRAENMVVEAGFGQAGIVGSIINATHLFTRHSTLELGAQFSASAGATIDFGDGHQEMFLGNQYADVVQLGDGDDGAYGAGGNDLLYGEEGDDALLGGDGDDALDGGDGRDLLQGGAGSDQLFGGSGDDRLDGGAGLDTMQGGAGDDWFHAGTQSDLIFENPDEGTDTVLAADNFYLYSHIENLTLEGGAGDLFGVGNELANSITGNEGSNLLIGGGAGDTLNGGSGIDSLFGEAGNDTLNGDAGIDYLAGGDGNDMLNGGADADALYGEDGDDVLDGGAGFFTDILVGGAGKDVLYGNSGLNDYDLMDGGAGNDSYYVDTGDDLTFEAMIGGGVDTVYADVSNVPNAGVYLYANVEKLVLLGTTAFGVGNELDNDLTGSASANWLLGGGGNDTINGKAGNDVLFGEAGFDTFVFQQGTGGDVIGDFDAAQDVIDISAFDFASFAALQTTFIQNGNVGAINLGNGDFIVLHNVTMASLDAGDFIL